MKTIAPDLRVVKTMKKLETALFHLLKDHPVETISVKELCREASVNRSTFYAYFQSISQLLDYFYEQYLKQFQEDICQKLVSTKSMKIYYLELLNHIRENKEIFYCLYTCDRIGFMEKTLSLAMDNLTCFSRDYPAVSEQDRLCVRLFNSYGCNGLIKLWLLNDCREPVEEMTEHLFRYTARLLQIHDMY